MKIFNRHEPNRPVSVNQTILPKEPEKMTKDQFENLIAALFQFEACVNSPIDGSPIGMIRTEDVINTIAEHMEIDLNQTAYSHFKK